MQNDVTDLLNALHNGSMTLDEVAQRFKARSWPRRQHDLPASYSELATADIRDPDSYAPGSYDDVAAAYHGGRLTDEQYTTLITAIAESKNAEDKRLDQ